MSGNTNRFLRSTNIKYDYSDLFLSENIFITNPIRNLIQKINESIVYENASKAISIIGPYGSGKSTGLLFTLKYFDGTLSLNQHKSLKTFHSNNNSLGNVENNIVKPFKNFKSCIIVGERKPLELCLRKELVNLSKSIDINVGRQTTIHIIEKLLKKYEKRHKGLIIVIDELGKFLENAIDNPTEGDIYLLQQIAELASRSNGSLIIITSRHQSFEAYSSTLSTAEINEWKKVQGRFEDVIFQLNKVESFLFISEAVSSIIKNKNELLIKSFIRKNKKFRIADLSDEIIENIFPLHPIVTYILSPVFKKLAQNERSVFSFLNSNEHFGFQYFLKEQTNTHQTYNISNFFDYIKTNMSFAVSMGPGSSTWTQIELQLTRNNSKDDLTKILIKTIGMIDVFRDYMPNDSNIEFIQYCLEGSFKKRINKSQITSTLDNLVKSDILTYNRTWKSYHIRFGSKINVNKVINDNITKEFDSNQCAEILNKSNPLPAQLAKRHYAKTGTIRYFVQKYAGEDFHIGEELKHIDKRKFHTDSEGIIYYVLCPSNSKIEALIKHLNNIFVSSSDVNNILVVFLRLNPKLITVFNYYRAVLTVRNNAPELLNDEIALLKVCDELQKAENDLDFEFQRLLTENKKIHLWFGNNSEVVLNDVYELNRKISDICDNIYSHTPLIHNEISNRNFPSPSGRIAIKELAINMINQEQENLGIESGAALSLYSSVLKKTGFHINKNGYYCYSLPKDKNIRKLWDDLDILLKSNNGEKIPLDSFYKIMTNPPFGIKKGLQPILALAFLQLNEGKISWYESDTFIINIDNSIIELLLKRPDLFCFKYLESSIYSTELYERIIKDFAIQGKNYKEITPLDILSPFLSDISHLPDYSKKTLRNIDVKTIRMRDVFLNAAEPEDILFFHLPKAFDLPAYHKMINNHKTAYLQHLKATYKELISIYDNMLSELSTMFFNELNIVEESNDLARKRVSIRFNSVSSILNDKELMPFIQRVCDDNLDDKQWIEGIASSVVNLPPNYWNDTDFNQFEVNLKFLVDKFVRIEKLYLKELDSKTFENIVRMSVTTSEGKDLYIVFNKSGGEYNSTIQDLEEIIINRLEELKLNKNDQNYVLSQLLIELLDRKKIYGK